MSDRVRCPGWAEFWRVDEVIECLPLGDNRRAIEAELLLVMPDAYDNKRPPDNPDWKPGCGEPRNELPPDPDQADLDGQSLRTIWRRLTKETRLAIIAAYEKEYGRDG
jgi:hypothetical protein